MKSGEETACPGGRGEAADRRSLESWTSSAALSSALFLGDGSAVPGRCSPVRKGPPWRSRRRATLCRALPSRSSQRRATRQANPRPPPPLTYSRRGQKSRGRRGHSPSCNSAGTGQAGPSDGQIRHKGRQS